MASEPWTRVTDFFLTYPTVHGPFNPELDLVGVSQGSVVFDRDGPSFALLAGIATSGKEIYYWAGKEIISTDPYFGTLPGPDVQDLRGKQYQVIDADVIWNFKSDTGALLLTLQNRSLAVVPIQNASVALGWFLCVETGRVKYDGIQFYLPRVTGTVP